MGFSIDDCTRSENHARRVLCKVSNIGVVDGYVFSEFPTIGDIYEGEKIALFIPW